MIGDRHQTKLFRHQVVDQVFGRLGAITEGGMQLQINSRIRSQHEMKSQCFQNLLPERSHLHRVEIEQHM